jgi:hypothetical protein
MGGFLERALESLPHAATSPLALIAYIFAIGAWVWIASRTKRLKAVLDKIDKVPKGERVRVIQHGVGETLPDNISSKHYLEHRRNQLILYAFLILCFLILGIFAISAWKAAFHPAEAQLSVDNFVQVLPDIRDEKKIDTAKDSATNSGGKTNNYIPQAGIAYDTDQDEFLSVKPAWTSRSKGKYAFDVVLRNPSDEPVTVIEVTIIFDPRPPEEVCINGGQSISSVYVTLISRSSAITTGPLGEFSAEVWYACSLSYYDLMVKIPVGQQLPPRTVDRFRLIVEFDKSFSLRGPMQTAYTMVYWNDDFYSKSKILQLSK